MQDRLILLEIFLRSMNAGASLLIACAIIAKAPRSWRHALGALFSVSAGAYVVASSPLLVEMIGAWFAPLHVLAILGGVFFWWFSLTLFDDGFRWRWPLFAPFVMTLPLVVANFALPHEPSALWTGSLVLARIALVFGYGHAIYTALRFANDDLIEGRRRFRFLFAIAVSIMGLIIVYVESIGADRGLPRSVMLFHAAAILLLTFAFGLWLIDSRLELVSPAPPDAPRPVETEFAGRLAVADRPNYEKLMRLMSEGVWREEGLTVSSLAEKVGLPEHQLRALINERLGHRNFSTFLRSYRIEEAMRLLASPEYARRQVLQIALDVGYGSIAPFNRAFKDATGKTPTEFRKEALAET